MIIKSIYLGWFNQIKENGGIFALKENIGDYNISYLFILALLTYIPVNSLISIKFFSIIFDFALAILATNLVKKYRKIEKFKEIICYAIFLFLPTVWLNSAVWAQCDAVYTSFILLSFIFLFNKKYKLSFLFLGIAFAFKLQTIFVLPIFIIVWIMRREFPLYYFLIVPIICVISCLPAVMVRKRFRRLLKNICKSNWRI